MKKNPYRYYRFLTLAGLLMLPATIVFWGVLGQNIPPYSAGLSADAFAAQIIANASSIRIGMIGQLFVSFAYFLWGLGICKVMEAAEQDNNVLSTIALWSVGLTWVVFAIPCSLWLTVAYRPEQMDPRTLQMFFDFGWFFFDNSFTITTMGMVAMGIGFLKDPREVPLVPAWVCWLAICVGIGFVLEVFMPLVTEGPFSRSGLINYWIEFSAYFAYWLATAIYVHKAAVRLQREYAQANGVA
jgi:hypothetical protein